MSKINIVQDLISESWIDVNCRPNEKDQLFEKFSMRIILLN